MENIFFEKQQLVAQWKSCLLAIQRRDKALQEIDTALLAQQEQAHSMETETGAYKKEIIKEQVKELIVSYITCADTFSSNLLPQ